MTTSIEFCQKELTEIDKYKGQPIVKYDPTDKEATKDGAYKRGCLITRAHDSAFKTMDWNFDNGIKKTYLKFPVLGFDKELLAIGQPLTSNSDTVALTYATKKQLVELERVRREDGEVWIGPELHNPLFVIRDGFKYSDMIADLGTAVGIKSQRTELQALADCQKELYDNPLSIYTSDKVDFEAKLFRLTLSNNTVTYQCLVISNRELRAKIEAEAASEVVDAGTEIFNGVKDILEKSKKE
jgi:hypothetical protein